MKNTISRIILVALAAAALAPTVAQAQPFSTNYWVTANYLAVLGRNPDPSGWVYWTAWVNANGGPTAQPLLTSALLASAEYCGFFGLSAGCTPNDGQFLTELYQNALGRAPDQAGWTFYLGLLADGVTPTQIVYDFISSAEFTNLYGAYCTAFFPGYATPLAYSTSASAVGGTTTAFTVTYASPSGTNDIVSGQVQFDSAIGCYVEWSGPTSAPTFWLNGTSAGCSLNPGSSIAAVPGNPQSIAVTFMLTFSEQSFVGTHQVTAWGLNAENLETPPQPLGSFVVTQGQDFTFSSLPGGTVTVPEGTYVTVTVTATSVNGFSGSVTPAVSVGPSCAYVWSDFSPGTLTLSAGQSATATVSIYNDYCTTGNNTAFTFQGTGESGTLWHTTPGIIVQGGAANFFVTVGTPSPSPALTSYQSVTYPVTVTSVNGFSGWVTLGVAGMPACATSPTSCVTGAFGSSPVYLSGSNSTATTTLTFSASANAPGGAFPITVTGSASGYNQQAAQFTLSTQVTTVTSTPTAVLNSGQSVQVPITLSANAPPITSCGILLSNGALDTNGSITGVTCSGSGSGSLNVTVTASAQAQHGTYVIALNGGAVQFHVAIADNVPGSPSGEYTVTAGQTATFTIDSPGPDDLYTEGTAVPLLDGGYVRWAYVYNVLPNSLTVTLSPPASVQAGGYTLDVNLCGCFFNTSERGGGNGDICEVVAPLEVEEPLEETDSDDHVQPQLHSHPEFHPHRLHRGVPVHERRRLEPGWPYRRQLLVERSWQHGHFVESHGRPLPRADVHRGGPTDPIQLVRPAEPGRICLDGYDRQQRGSGRLGSCPLLGWDLCGGVRPVQRDGAQCDASSGRVRIGYLRFVPQPAWHRGNVPVCPERQCTGNHFQLHLRQRRLL